jgi:glucokinase
MLTLGVDIGGTNTRIGLVYDGGKIIADASFKTQDYAEAEEYANALANQIKRLLYDYGIEACSIGGLGIGAPNGNYFKGTIEFAPNLKWRGIVPLTDMLEYRFPLWGIRLTNDANAAALGERMFGKAGEVDDFIMITLGTGVGSGVFSGGRLIYGHDGFAGEIGHSLVEPGGRLCGCGREGCLEAYASASGIVKTAKELMKTREMKAFLLGKVSSSLLEEIKGELEARHIGEAALQGDYLAQETFNITAGKLAFALANAVTVTSPEVIYLFGGIAAAGDALMKPLREGLERQLLQIYKGKIRIEWSGLPPGDAAILGAAALVR